MPENEVLGFNTRLESRCALVRSRIHAGASGEQALRDIRKDVRRTLANCWARWQKLGVRPDEFFAQALSDPDQLSHYLKLARWDEFAKLLVDVAKSHRGCDRPTLVHDFLVAAWDVMRDRMDVDSLSRDQRQIVLSGMDRFVDYLVERMSRDPSEIPRLPPGEARKQDLDDLLAQPLPLT